MSDFLSPLHSPKDSKVQLSSIIETASKTLRDQPPTEERESYRNNTRTSDLELSKDNLLIESLQKIGKSRTSTNRGSKVQKISFADIVGATIKNERKMKVKEEEKKHIQRVKEREESLAKPIRHSDIELNVVNKQDILTIEDYENEVLGTYKSYKGNVYILKCVNGIKRYKEHKKWEGSKENKLFEAVEIEAKR